MFSLRLKGLREDTGMSQYAFADRFGVAQSTVGGWESGKREPNFEMAKKLADYFNVSVGYLLGHTDSRIDNTVIDPIPVGPLVKVPVIGSVRCGNGSLVYEELLGHESTEEADKVHYSEGARMTEKCKKIRPLPRALAGHGSDRVTWAILRQVAFRVKTLCSYIIAKTHKKMQQSLAISSYQFINIFAYSSKN